MFIGLRNVLLLFVCLFFAMGQAWAVALGKIEVTSHLGETFFAEAPVLLEAGEKISDVSIELAASSDYQILEVFRDAVLNRLNVDIKNDLRGPRAVISSTEAVDMPYFNLVLKMKHGHATNFKKYPVFLDLPEQVRPAASEGRAVEQTIAPPAHEEATTVDRMQADEVKPAAVSVSVHPLEDAEATAEPVVVDPAGSKFKPYEGWARTGRYGPMVRGDTISTVARRLSVDERYTHSQVMIGLFNKNKEKFRENNINLINAGTYLDVPAADEIEAIQDRDARSVLKEHGQRWRDLKSQPVYAAEAEAQENRYRTRVHVGKAASGVAAAPVQGGQAQPEAADKNIQEPEAGADGLAQGETAQLRALQEENLRLKQALQESETRAADSQPATADAAVAEEQVRKLELTVARLQQQLKQVDLELQEVRTQDMNALTYALSGIIVLLIAVAAYLLFLLRRDRPHPATDMPAAQPAAEIESVSVTDDSASEDAGSEDLGHGMLAESPDAELENTDVAQSPALQAGVDYVAEAEVYLRYGMEDEALQQLKLAIEHKPDHVQAHSKLVEILQGRGDQLAMAAAVETARSVLAADDLQAFEDSLPPAEGDAAQSAELDAEEEPSFENDAMSIDMPDMDLAEDDVAEAVETGAEMDAGEQAEEVTVDLSDQLESDQLTSDQPASDQPASDQPASDQLPPDQSGSDLDLDLSGFDVPDLDAEPGEEKEASDEAAYDSGLDPEADTALDMGEPVESPVEPEALEEAGDDDAEGLEFTLDDKDLTDTDALGALASDDEQDVDDGIAFEAPGESADENVEAISGTVIDASAEDDERDLDAILGELGTDVGPSVDFVTAADAVSPLQSGTAEDTVPETVIDTASAGEDLDLDEILGEFDHLAEHPGADSGATGDDATDSSDIADMPEMDVSDELDGLLAEWGEGGSDVALDTGPESLDVDRARSLLAEGSLDEAEAALKIALAGDRRGDALIGLAEVAAKRGDDARKNGFLTEAEMLVDDSNRAWFDLVKNLSA